ncbi:MAG: hypothetical protein JW983_06535 [Elusimicrobia bacterium]|nr:hypothetical protein [Elusimicrobiota bacterium]
MAKICFIGENEATGFWRGLGTDVLNAVDEKTARNNIRLAVEQHYDLIYITKTFAVMLLDFIEKINLNSDSIITIVPGVELPSSELSLKKLRQLSIKAIGSPPPEE